MEILHRGELPEEKKYKVTCSRCHTIFRFKQSEARYESDFRDGDYLHIACPVCGHPVTVSL